MKEKRPSRSGFFDRRILFGLGLCCVLLALIGFVVSWGASALAQKPDQNEETFARPDVVPMVGPISQDQDLRTLPYIPANEEEEELRLMRHPLPQTSREPSDPIQAVRQVVQPLAMPTPSLTFGGITSATSGCGCLPPDTHGDVGPNHYIQGVNSSIKIFDKTGATLSGPTTYNSFFSAMGVTPCGINQNRGDGFVFYDHLADRWVVSDFAFAAFPGVSFYQCIGVSKTSNPVAGGWWLYAVQVDPANPTFLGDYPKFGLWPDAYYFSVNLFSNNTTFNGVRVFALNRSGMINGTGAPNASVVAFNISPANLGDAYSLVPATFRTGLAPPVGTPEYFLAIDSPATSGVSLTQVHAWRFHVDFVTPANSTFGVGGASHLPNGNITVNSFVDAFTTTTAIVPQNGTTSRLDTLGDKLMTPLAYQNRGGTESLWVSHTINNNQGGTGPTAIRWYQFNVTGSTIPAAPVQQQSFNNAADGLWRWMPSVAVDTQGNMAIGYTASSSTSEPSIRYAGRLATDPPNGLAQGEAILIAGGGHQTSTSGRWGDYSAMGVDPVDNLTFWHTNEYYTATSNAGWNTRIGNFKFATSTPAPTPTPFASISGTVLYCSNPVPGPVPNVTLTRTGTTSGSTLSNGSGNYTFPSLPSGGNYTVTPTKIAVTPGSANIDTVDVIAVQRHFLNLGTPLSGCRLTAADVNGDLSVDTSDVIAIQRFSLEETTGIANVGKYKFTPVSRSYLNLMGNQTAQNYDTLVFGDVASSFVERRDGPLPNKAQDGAITDEVAARRAVDPAMLARNFR